MSLGVLRVTLTNVNLESAKTLSGESTTVEINVGSQRSIISRKGKAFKCKEVSLFGCEKDFMDIYVYNEEFRGSRIVYGHINLNPLLGMPKVKHLVELQTVYFENDVIINEESGWMNLEIIYTDVLDSVLEITVESANLIRDTELVGKMDPYTEITLEGEMKKTTVKDEGGKNPVWGEKLIFILKKPESELFVEVKDLDMTTSDLVGTAHVKLRELGLLNPENGPKTLTVELMYKEKVAGHLTLTTNFTINHYKK